jgi:ATP-binding cassette subfamily C protein/ATP-binding cassette subfamily C protein LapB
LPWLLPRLMALLGHDATPRMLRDALPHAFETEAVDNDGVALLGALGRLGVTSRPWRKSAHRLKEAMLPALWLRPDGSAALVLGRQGRFLIVQSEAEGGVWRMHSSGLPGTLHVFAGRDEGDAIAGRPLLPALAAAHAPLIAGLFALSLLGSAASIALGLVVMITFDMVIPTGHTEALAVLAAGFLLALAIDISARALIARGIGHLGERAERRVLTLVFEKVMRLSWLSVAAQDPASQVARMREVEAARELFSGPLPQLILQVPLVVLFLLVIWLISGPLVLVPLAVLPLQILAALVLVPRARVAERRAATLIAERRRVMLETLSHAMTLRAVGAEAAWLARFRDLSAGAASAQARATLASHSVQAVVQAGMPVSAAALATVGAHLVIQGVITSGALVASIMMSWRMLAPMQSLLLAASRGRQVADSVRQLHRLQSLREEPRPPPDAPMPTPRDHSLRFDRAFYRPTPNAEPVLAGVSLAVPAGARVAVTGPSGAGKSSLLRLALGLAQPQAGAVLFGGVNLAQFEPAELRARIGYVPQRPGLIYGTIAQNLRLAAPAAVENELEAVCDEIGILDDLRVLPEGFATRIDDLGKERLSQGLGQGLAIAQALLRRPRLLLLDDPTRGLDAARIARLDALLDRLRGRVTILMVTHRIAQLRACDLVVTLERGVVVATERPQPPANQIETGHAPRS